MYWSLRTAIFGHMQPAGRGWAVLYDSAKSRLMHKLVAQAAFPPAPVCHTHQSVPWRRLEQSHSLYKRLLVSENLLLACLFGSVSSKSIRLCFQVFLSVCCGGRRLMNREEGDVSCGSASGSVTSQATDGWLGSCSCGRSSSNTSLWVVSQRL